MGTTRNIPDADDLRLYDCIWQNLRRDRGLEPELTDSEADGAVAILLRSQAPSGVITSRLWSHRRPLPAPAREGSTESEAA